MGAEPLGTVYREPWPGPDWSQALLADIYVGLQGEPGQGDPNALAFQLEATSLGESGRLFVSLTLAGVLKLASWPASCTSWRPPTGADWPGEACHLCEGTGRI